MPSLSQVSEKLISGFEDFVAHSTLIHFGLLCLLSHTDALQATSIANLMEDIAFRFILKYHKRNGDGDGYMLRWETGKMIRMLARGG